MKFIRGTYLWFIFLLPILAVNGCGIKHTSKGPITVPQVDHIPHYNDTHIAITKDIPFSQMPDKPAALSNLYRYLQHPDNFTQRKINTIALVNQMLYVGNNRLLFLDQANNNLTEYDLKTDSAYKIAGSGKGPGDLLFAGEMVKRGATVYVAQQMQISRFNCAVMPCQYSGTTELKFMPYSVALAGDSIAVLGNVVGFGSRNPGLVNKLKNLKAIHLINGSGNQVSVFGDAYNVGTDWMLLRPFVSEGFVRYSITQKQFLIAFQQFPIIYVYGSNLKLIHSYKISDFILNKMKYIPHSALQFNWKIDRSMIKTMSVFKGNYLLIETVTATNSHVSDHLVLSDWQHNFYVLNLTSQKSYYMGKFTTTGSSPNADITATSKGLFIYKGEDAYWIGM